MSSDFSRPVDAWSRFIAYCALTVALGTLGWVWLTTGDVAARNGNTSKSEAGELAAMDQKFDKYLASRKERDDEMLESIRVEQQNQLQVFTDAANGQLSQHHSLIKELNSSLTAATFTANTAVGTESTTADGGVDGAEPAAHGSDDRGPDGESPESRKQKIAEMRPSIPADSLRLGDPATAIVSGDTEDTDAGSATDDSAGFFSPLLSQVIETRKADGSENESGVVTIRNTGNGKAILTRIRFTPANDYDAIFEVDSPVSLSTSDDEEVIEIVFDEQDNQAGEVGKHGVYMRELTTAAIGVTGGETMQIRLAIANEKHLGWGFRGKLEISYNGLDPLVINDAELAFVNSPQPIVQK